VTPPLATVLHAQRREHPPRPRVSAGTDAERHVPDAARLEPRHPTRLEHEVLHGGGPGGREQVPVARARDVVPRPSRDAVERAGREHESPGGAAALVGQMQLGRDLGRVRARTLVERRVLRHERHERALARERLADRQLLRADADVGRRRDLGGRSEEKGDQHLHR